MKRIHYSLFVAAFACVLFCVGCDRTYDPVFGEDPDDRLRTSMQQYQAALQDAPHGWKALLETGAGVKYLYYFDFEADGTVTMVSDFNTTSAGTVATGTWIMKALQRPTVSFDSYSYIHLPADPNGSVNGGGTGTGLISDFEFAFARTAADTFYLDGIQRGSHITLVRATEPEALALRAGVMKGMLDYLDSTRGLRMVLDGRTVTLAFDQVRRMVTAQSLSADNSRIEVYTSSYTFSSDGVVLEAPLRLYGKAIKSFAWNAEAGNYTTAGDVSIDVVAVEALYFFELPVPAYAALGTTYRTVQIPQGSGVYPMPGHSKEFTLSYNEAATRLLESEFRAALQEINLNFRPADKILMVDVYITQGSARHLCQYEYIYTINSAGVIDFVFNDANANGQAIYDYVYGMLLRHLNDETFTVAYVGGGYDLTAGFFSRETALYSFSGYLIR